MYIQHGDLMSRLKMGPVTKLYRNFLMKYYRHSVIKVLYQKFSVILPKLLTSLVIAY